MKISGIYKIQSISKPQRLYIGSACNISRRFKEHFNALKRNGHHSKQLQRHFNKYGIADLQFSVLLGCDKEDLLKNEQYFLDSYKPYFNSLITAGSRLGMKWSDEEREKLSKSHIGIVNRVGFHHSEETKRKIGEKSKGRPIWNKGKKMSDSQKNKLRIAHLGKIHSEEHKKKIGDASRGRKMSDNFKKKIKDSWVKRKLKNIV